MTRLELRRVVFVVIFFQESSGDFSNPALFNGKRVSRPHRIVLHLKLRDEVEKELRTIFEAELQARIAHLTDVKQETGRVLAQLDAVTRSPSTTQARAGNRRIAAPPLRS